MDSPPVDRPPLPQTRLRAAWAVALVVDAIQIPSTATGPLGWLIGAGLDVVTMAAMWALLGFHWAFLPSFVTEWIPYLNLAPFWTLAVALATRGRGGGSTRSPGAGGDPHRTPR